MDGVERSHVDENDDARGQGIALDVVDHLAGNGLRRDVQRHIEGFKQVIF